MPGDIPWIVPVPYWTDSILASKSNLKQSFVENYFYFLKSHHYVMGSEPEKIYIYLILVYWCFGLI